MSVSPLPVPAPSRATQSNAEFSAAVDALFGGLPDFITEFNESVEAIIQVAAAVYSGTSADSVSIGTGTKSFPNASTGRGWVGGQTIIISSGAAPTTNYMEATVTSYNATTGALVVNVPSGGNHGSGSHTDWSIGLTINSALYAALAGADFTGPVRTPASASGGAGLRIPHGAAPSSPTNGDIWSTTSGVFIRLNGTTFQIASSAAVQEIPIPAKSLTIRTTNGAAPGTSETTTNKIMIETLDFDQSTAEYAQFAMRMPKRWNAGTITAKFVWMASTGSGDVVWACQALAVSNDDNIGAAFGTAQTVTDTVTATGDLLETSVTAAITVNGTPAKGDWVVFQFYRDAANGSDTLNADAKLISVVLTISTDVGDDS